MSEGRKPFTGGFKPKQKTRQRARTASVFPVRSWQGAHKRLGSSGVESMCPWVPCWFLDVELGYHGLSPSLISESEKEQGFGLFSSTF